MSATRCFACGEAWSDCYASRLVDEHDPERWVRVVVCDRCWQAASNAEQARLREWEWRLLAAWDATREEQTG